MERFATCYMFDIFLVAFVVLFPHYVPLPFYSYAIVCLAAIFFYLKRQNKTLRNIGLKKSGLTVRAFAVGLLSAVVWVAIMQWMYIPVIKYFFVVKDYTEYDFIKNNLKTLIPIIIAAWLVGGFYEEIVFRGFIQSTLTRWFDNTHYSFWIAGVLSSLLFGLYHWQQGIWGVIPAVAGGLYWTFILWCFNGNLWYTILSHAIYDTIALTMIYFGVFGF